MSSSHFRIKIRAFLAKRKADFRILFNDLDEMNLVRAAHLQANISIALFGGLGTCLGLAALIWDKSIAAEILIWLSLSLLPALIRIWMMSHYREVFRRNTPTHIVKSYLRIYAISTTSAGLVFFIGWLMLVPQLEQTNQFVYLLAIIALLFGALHTYSPQFLAFIGFSFFAIWCVPVASIFYPISTVKNINYFIFLVGLVSTMFAVRFSIYFSMNNQLRKNIEKLLSELTQKHEEAIAANNAKSRFLASVSHDLRQPMHAISLYTAALEKLIGSDIDQPVALMKLRDQVRRLMGTTNYMNEMFETLINVSRLDAGVTPIAIKPVELMPILRRIEQEYSAVAEKLSLRFQIQIKISKHIVVFADSNALERIVRNLISNAIKNTSNGGVRLVISEKLEKIEIRIVDTGRGIDRRLREKIFGEFFQVHEAAVSERVGSQLGHGLGLGLSIAQRFAKRMDSQILCRSWFGKGSIFYFQLPMAESLENTVLNIQSKPSYTGLPEGLFVVVVDDDIDIQDSTRQFLELAGAQVVTASDSKEVIVKLGSYARVPDFLICDYRLQFELGLAVIDTVRNEFNQDIPALLITGETMQSEISKIKDSGFSILFKPLSSDELINSIRRELSNV